jgi:hypothetical protein
MLHVIFSFNFDILFEKWCEKCIINQQKIVMRKMQSLEMTLTLVWLTLFFYAFTQSYHPLLEVFYRRYTIICISWSQVMKSLWLLKTFSCPKHLGRHRWEHLWWPWLLSTNLVLLLDAFFCFFIVFCLFPFSFSPLLSHKTKQNKINPLTLLILCFCVWNMKCGHVLVQASFFLLLLWQ